MNASVETQPQPIARKAFADAAYRFRTIVTVEEGQAEGEAESHGRVSVRVEGGGDVKSIAELGRLNRKIRGRAAQKKTPAGGPGSGGGANFG